MSSKLRIFLTAFFLTLLFWGCAGGLLTVWVNTQSVLTPDCPALRLVQTGPNDYTLSAFDKSLSFSLPRKAAGAAARVLTRWPALCPRTLRIAAWGFEKLKGYFPLPVGY